MAEYRLLDFGDGRKLEAIGELVLDRPSPAAEGVSKHNATLWRNVDSRFLKVNGRAKWVHRIGWPQDLSVDCGGFSMPVAPTPFGHIGLFPEQRENWAWIQNFGRSLARDCGRMPVFRVLNLFAYTGASTLAAASSIGGLGLTGGLEIVHVDAAKPNVQAAKRAAMINGLAHATDGQLSVRFIVEDARKFVGREIRRGRRYDLIVLDPPAYGHGTKGAAWRLERDLWPLLEDCLRLLDDRSDDRNIDGGNADRDRLAAKGLLITGHTAACGPAEIRSWMRERGEQVASLGKPHEELGRAGLIDCAGRFLDAGFYMRMMW